MSEPAIRLIAAVAALIIMSIGFAHAQTVQKVEVYEFGVYISAAETADGLTRRGAVHTVTDRVELVQPTRTVIARIGTYFGIRYRLIGTPRGMAVPITVVERFPKPGVRPAGVDQPFTDDAYTTVQRIGDGLFHLASFKQPSELVPGVWTIELWINGKKLAEEKFNVILPPIADRQSPALLGTGKVG